MSRTARLLLAAMAAVLACTYALHAVFTTMEWFWPAFWSIPLAFGLGWVGRRLDVPAALRPALYVVGLGLLLGFFFHLDTTFFGVPTLATVRAIGTSLDLAAADIKQLAAPVAVTPALSLVTAGGVYVVASLVDLLVFSARRPAAAGLPLLALYVVPATLAPGGIGALPFALAAAGYVGLLIAEGRERVGRWGQRVVGLGVVDEVNDLSPVGRVGRRLGAAAVGVALIVPVFVPDLGQGLLGGEGGGLLGNGGGGGGGRVNVVNPIVQIKGRLVSTDRSELIRVETARPAYLRLTSLDSYDNEEWTQSELSAGTKQRLDKDDPLPDPPGLDGGPATTSTANITVRELKSPWLPAPYAPHVVDVRKGDWRYDAGSLTLFSLRSRAEGLTYSVESVIAEPTADLLDQQFSYDGVGTEVARSLQRPRNPDAQVALELERIVAGKRTPYQRVMAIQNHFRSGRFTYTTDVPDGTGQDRLREFFLTRRSGYCEQFAATMAYLVRLLGIPARVAIGFSQGRQVGESTYSVSNADAHAWPEVYFPGAGWLPFEPTPGGAASAPPSYAAPAVTEPTTPTTPTTPIPTTPPTTTEERDMAACLASGQSAQQCREDILESRRNENLTAPDEESGAGSRRALLIALALGLLALAALAPSSVQRWAAARRRRLPADAAHVHAAWRALADAAEDVGLPLRRSDSPRAAARRLAGEAELRGDATTALRLLATAEERARYAPTMPGAEGLEEALREVRRGLLAQVPTARRLRAIAFPPSVLRRATEGWLAAYNRLLRRWDAFRLSLVSRLRRAPA